MPLITFGNSWFRYIHPDGVPDFAEPLEIDALDDLPVLYIEAGDDALCDHVLISSRVM